MCFQYTFNFSWGEHYRVILFYLRIFCDCDFVIIISLLELKCVHYSFHGVSLLQPLCDNHDDGETQALILCEKCGNLCGECDRVLHYRRANKSHQRQVCLRATHSLGCETGHVCYTNLYTLLIHKHFCERNFLPVKVLCSSIDYAHTYTYDPQAPPLSTSWIVTRVVDGIRFLSQKVSPSDI